MSFDGYKYYLIFVDHFTKYIWFYALRHKSDTKDVFNRFKALVEKYFGMTIHHLYLDNGTEYLALKDILALDGITWLTTPPHTPQHDGCSERRHCHIVKRLVFLFYTMLPCLFFIGLSLFLQLFISSIACLLLS